MFLLIAVGMGCSSAQNNLPHFEAMSQPAPEFNGEDAAQQRLSDALNRLRSVYDGPTWIHVLEASRPAAYSCADGNIYVSLGIVDFATDNELCAVIAHELGHLAGNTRASAGLPYALSGASGGGQEERADAFAIGFLRKSGVPVTALAQVLGKVRDAAQTPAELRDGLTARIRLLPNQ